MHAKAKILDEINTIFMPLTHYSTTSFVEVYEMQKPSVRPYIYYYSFELLRWFYECTSDYILFGWSLSVCLSLFLSRWLWLSVDRMLSSVQFHYYYRYRCNDALIHAQRTLENTQICVHLLRAIVASIPFCNICGRQALLRLLPSSHSSSPPSLFLQKHRIGECNFKRY